MEKIYADKKAYLIAMKEAILEELGLSKEGTAESYAQSMPALALAA